ncbi:hypothetical protein ACTXT7_007965, partial [Hymenolepis weldensis]
SSPPPINLSSLLVSWIWWLELIIVSVSATLEGITAEFAFRLFLKLLAIMTVFHDTELQA